MLPCLSVFLARPEVVIRTMMQRSADHTRLIPRVSSFHHILVATIRSYFASPCRPGYVRDDETLLAVHTFSVTLSQEELSESGSDDLIRQVPPLLEAFWSAVALPLHMAFFVGSTVLTEHRGILQSARAF